MAGPIGRGALDESESDRQLVRQGMTMFMVDLLSRTLAEIEAYEEQLPCVLVCTDLDSGDQTVSGPFPTRTAGALTMEHEIASAGPDSRLAFSLMPLYPALELGRPAPCDGAAPPVRPV
ncbi:hypothetical protein ACJ5H2_20425 [Nocardioides sp. R1-1]|uniref:hypothetical protein n=1 Tax=Nocardioides sp. R1-1 TaxID=3383502 RepID=UPI0038D02E23